VTGVDLRTLAMDAMYRKSRWPPLAEALGQAVAGDASAAADLADAIGDEAALTDGFLAYTANENRWPRDLQAYLDAGENAFGLFDHLANGFFYEEADRALWPTRPHGAFYGPFRYPEGNPLLVMANTHDPATPFVWAKRFVKDLGRLLAYLERGVLPPVGAQCIQDPAVFTPSG